MSAAARIAGKVHKWLALLLAIQILFWFVSGLFFAIAPIEQVRSEHIKATAAPGAVSAPVAAAGALMAKYTPGLRLAAATSAMMATKDSSSMPP